MQFELNLKSKDSKPAKNDINVPKVTDSAGRKKLWQSNSSIVFKREDFIQYDKAGSDAFEALKEKLKTHVKIDAEAAVTDHTFEALDLHQHLKYKLTQQLKFNNLTPIQHQAFLPISQGRDVFIKSATGTGKTLAFLVPIMDKILREPNLTRQQLRMLVISPTRELSAQTEQLIRKIADSTTLVVSSFTGGMSREAEKTVLRRGTNVFVCTPGRLQDHIKSSANLPALLQSLRYLVLDECDALLAGSFKSLFDQLSPLLPVNIQRVLVSATIPDSLVKFAQSTLKNPLMVQQGAANFALPPALEQRFVVVGPRVKLSIMIALLAENRAKRSLVFAESKAVCDFLLDIFIRVQKQLGIFDSVQALHGGLDAEARVAVWKAFVKSGGVLIVTDVAARGLNLGGQDTKQKDQDSDGLLSGVDIVIQYEAPSSIEQYVHRAGRAGRIGQSGTSVLFVQPNEVKLLDTLVAETGQLIRYLQPDTIGRNILGFENPIRLFEKIQAFVEEQVLGDDNLKEMAIQAYQTYTAGYRVKDAAIKQCFDFSSLHLGHVAKSFGLNDAPSKLTGMSKRSRQIDQKDRDWQKSSEKTKSLMRKRLVSK